MPIENTKMCQPTLRALKSHPISYVFLIPVERIGLRSKNAKNVIFNLNRGFIKISVFALLLVNNSFQSRIHQVCFFRFYQRVYTLKKLIAHWPFVYHRRFHLKIFGWSISLVVLQISEQKYFFGPYFRNTCFILSNCCDI